LNTHAIVVAASLLLSSYGCESSNGITAPTPTPTPTPIPNVNISGNWRGTLDQGQFDGTCVADVYEESFERLFPLRLEIAVQQAAGSAQVAATTSLSILGSDLGSGGFVGLSEGNDVTIDATEPILLAFLRHNTTMQVRCLNGRVVRLTAGTTRLRGSGTSTNWSGTYTETIQVSGAETGVFRLEARFNVSK
jgi:hypothetical protein